MVSILSKPCKDSLGLAMRKPRDGDNSNDSEDVHEWMFLELGPESISDGRVLMKSVFKRNLLKVGVLNLSRLDMFVEKSWVPGKFRPIDNLDLIIEEIVSSLSFSFASLAFSTWKLEFWLTGDLAGCSNVHSAKFENELDVEDIKPISLQI